MIVRTLYLCFLALFAFSVSPHALAQADESFLNRVVPLAQKSQRETTVPASVTLAQAMWETGRGKSPIGDANNYFGIKAAGVSDDAVNVGPVATGWVWAWTKEWDGKKYIERKERFRKYNSLEDSFRDHGLLLATTPRYANAMLAVDDPREFARRIALAGYATSPTYANDLIRMMDAEALYQYDLPRNATELVGQSETAQVNAGDIFQIYFDVKNTGFGTWSPAANYYLASVNSNRFGAKGEQPLDLLVAPERQKRWVLAMIAPDLPGTYSTTWRMKHGTQDFGPEMTVQVRVREREGVPLWLWLGGGAALAGLAIGGTLLFRGKRTTRRRKNKTLRSLPYEHRVHL